MITRKNTPPTMQPVRILMNSASCSGLLNEKSERLDEDAGLGRGVILVVEGVVIAMQVSVMVPLA
jgi:hypothetical protein